MVLSALEIAFVTGLAGIIIWAVKKFLKGLEDTSTKFSARLEQQDKTLGELKDGQAQHRTSMAELRTALIGLDGQNGINSMVKSIETRVQRLEQRRAQDYTTPVAA